jgi:hypothetical protein
MIRPYKSAADALAASPLAGLIDRARLLEKIALTVAEVSRETESSLALPAAYCALERSTVIITVSTSSEAAKLRQRAAALTLALQKRLPEVTGIRIRLQPGLPARPQTDSGAGGSARSSPSAAPAAPSCIAALDFADQLARELHDSPLRQSALRLQASLRARLKAESDPSPDG